jgi:hypothetical protein
MENNKDDNNNKIFPVIFQERIHRHISSAPPENAYFFFPKDDDIIELDGGNSKRLNRKIFEGKDDFYPLERTKLIELKQLLSKEKESLNFPPDWQDHETLRFLQATGHDPAKTINLLKEHLTWKNGFFPITLNKNVNEILDSGLIYIHGRDNHFRPVIIINAILYLTLSKLYPYEDFLLSIIYFIEYIIKTMLIPGQVESWIIIADVSGISMFKPPTDLMSILKILQSNYRCRLAIIYILGMNSVLNLLWTVVKQFLGPNTQKKIRFLKENTKNDIFTYINPEQVEEKLGGLAKNVTKEIGFFPPTMPSGNYFKPEDDPQKILIDEERYIEMAVFENKLSVISPYIIDKVNAQRKKIECDSCSMYEDACTHVQGHLQSKNNTSIQYGNLNDHSIYDNCVDNEDVFVIDHENLGTPRSKINSIEYTSSPSKIHMSGQKHTDDIISSSKSLNK